MCCGSDDDYHTVSSYQPETRRPPRQHRYPSHEDEEKRQRQAEATAAARKYGWPTPRGDGYSEHPNRFGNRDSMIEPGLAQGLATMPGSDFKAVYDPQRTRRPPPPPPPHDRQQPIYRPPPPPRYQQNPPHYTRGLVNQQPGRSQPMRAEPHPDRREPRQRPGVARRPIIQTPSRVPHAPQMAEIVRKPVMQQASRHAEAGQEAKADDRRDSNNVSECSDVGDLEYLRSYTVSPLHTRPDTPPSQHTRGERFPMGVTVRSERTPPFGYLTL